MTTHSIACPMDSVWRALRSQDVTASVASALLGCHEFDTPLSLYLAKRSDASEKEETPAMRRGRYMEHAAVALLRAEHGDLEIRHNDGDARFYYRDPDARIGATPDVLATCKTRGRGVIQIKSVAASTYNRKWLANGEPQPPLWISAQAVVEASLTGAQWAAVMPIVVDGYGNMDAPLIDIPLTHAPAVMERLRHAVADFWRRVESGDPPPATLPADADLVMSRFDGGEGEIDLSYDERAVEIIAQREELKARERDGAAAEKERRLLDAELLVAMGNCSRAIIGEHMASVKIIKRDAYQVKASQYPIVTIKEARQ